MIEFFQWFGVTCAGIISVSFLYACGGYYAHAKNVSYYKGIRRQIQEAIGEIDDRFVGQYDMPIPAYVVRRILVKLHNRQDPNIMQVKLDAEDAAQARDGGD